MSRHFWDIVLILDRLLGFGATHVWKAIRSLLHTLPGSTPTHKWTKGRIVWGHSCCTTLVQHSILKKVFVWGENSISKHLFDLREIVNFYGYVFGIIWFGGTIWSILSAEWTMVISCSANNTIILTQAWQMTWLHDYTGT